MHSKVAGLCNLLVTMLLSFLDPPSPLNVLYRDTFIRYHSGIINSNYFGILVPEKRNVNCKLKTNIVKREIICVFIIILVYSFWVLSQACSSI